MMQAVFDRMAARLRTLVTRGRVVSAALNPRRPLIQLSGLAGEVKTEVELFMPMGMSVYPTGNEDIVLLQVGGSRSHLVALFADNPALRIADLQPGEFGHRDGNGQQVVFRQDHLEITSPLNLVVKIDGDVTLTVGGKVTGTATSWDLTGPLTVHSGDITALDGNVADKKNSMAGDRALYNQHRHGSSPPPDPPQ